MNFRVLIIGATGFVGSRVCRSLANDQRITVSRSSRTPTKPGVLTLDLNKADTFKNSEPFDAIVNCADVLLAAPDALAEIAIQRGQLFIQPQADLNTFERLWMHHTLLLSPSRTGTLILGVGLFPGLSGLLAKHAMDACGLPTRVDTAVRIGLFSGCGPGVCRLMVHRLMDPRHQYVKGVRKTLPSIGAAHRFPFSSGRSTAWVATLADSLLLHWSQGIAGTQTSIALWPRALNPLLRPLSRLIALSKKTRRTLGDILFQALYLTRSRLFSWRPMPVEIVARAQFGDGEQVFSLQTSEGFRATACATAAATVLLLEAKPEPGLLFLDQVTDLHALLGRMKQLEPEINLEWSETH